MKAQIFQGPGALKGSLFHDDGALAAWSGPEIGTIRAQDVMEALQDAADSAADEGCVLRVTENFIDPHGTHKRWVQDFEIRLAWETIRSVASFDDEFMQDHRTPSVGACSYAVSECGPTLKAINTALERDARHVRAVISPMGRNLFQLTWQN
jgi:hypothetical protein